VLAVFRHPRRERAMIRRYLSVVADLALILKGGIAQEKRTTPHAQDEVYVVIRGRGVFFHAAAAERDVRASGEKRRKE
jgi:hypothetical protein